jgi:FkbM family methyltransferase
LVKRAIQFVASTLGYEVHRAAWFGPNKLEVMRRIGINFVLDVGANDGVYAADLRRHGFKGKIWSYEPMHEAFAKLDKAAAADQLWKAIHCGCGARTGTAQINIAGNSYSSSLLPMLGLLRANAPETEYVSEESVSICTLDESVIPHLKPDDRLWLKIDTQGYEGEVLKGAERLMPRVEALECELSLAPLYEGQLLIDEMLRMIYRMGFRMVGVSPVFLEPATGYALQIDGTFVRA